MKIYYLIAQEDYIGITDYKTAKAVFELYSDAKYIFALYTDNRISYTIITEHTFNTYIYADKDVGLLEVNKLNNTYHKEYVLIPCAIVEEKL